MGVQPRVETNLPLSKDQEWLKLKKVIIAVRERNEVKHRNEEKGEKMKASKAREKRKSDLWNQVIEEYKTKLNIEVKPMQFDKRS